MDEESWPGPGGGTLCEAPIDAGKARFPCCLVWTPLPIVSWLSPILGHVGVCGEDGIVRDFAGPYFVNIGTLTFGPAARYVRLNPDKCCFPANMSAHKCKSAGAHAGLGTAALSWDDGLRIATQHYQHNSYNFFTCNCHSFVAYFLNRIAYGGSTKWNVVHIAILVLLQGRWVNSMAVVRAFGPVVLVMCLGLALAGWSFLFGWFALLSLLALWFLLGTVSGLVTT